MSVLTGILRLFAGGTKQEKDSKEIEPYVRQILAQYETIDKLSDDELRTHSDNLRIAIAAAIAPTERNIAELKLQLEAAEVSLSDKERFSKDIDTLTKEVDNIIEKKLDEILPDAFAIMKSTARRFSQNETIEVTATDFDRTLAAQGKDFVEIKGEKALYKNHWLAGGNMTRWDMVHYDVQLFGGVVLHKGRIAEMATGEGKTLVATLPVFLNALAGKGVHVVTVNDYLSKRDAEWMGPMYQFHGLSVDCIDLHKPNSDERRKAYLADITFGTNNEFGFDYLRDNMAHRLEELVQRKHHYAIVDEVDSILIDDARTPLIISGPVPKGDDQLFDQYKGFVDGLYNVQRTLVNNLLQKARTLIQQGKTDEGGVLLYRAHRGLPKYKPLIKFLSEEGMRVLLLKSEAKYIAENSKLMPLLENDLLEAEERENKKIKDENDKLIREGGTPTKMEKRFGDEALYFVIDEKINSVELAERGHTYLSDRVKEENFFILPEIGTEVASIERSELSVEEKAAKKDEVINSYAIKSERVHTVNQLLKAYAMFEKDIEYVIIDNKVKIVDEQTGRIMEGRRYSDGLHQAIEAKENVKVEAATQTFATITLQNYFRMYHKLAGMTGTAETEAGEFWNIYKLDVVVIPTNRPILRKDFNDKVYRTKREKYNAVIDEVTSLVAQGRPVLVGTTSVEVSELLGKILKLRGIKHNVLNAKNHAAEAQIVAEAGRAGQVTIATNMAGRGTDIKLTPEVKAAGGLAIVGTERHESRRVDRQLRGRAGRQGDPGSSLFFVSLEDDLMRMFAVDRLARIMDRMGIKEGEEIQAGLMTRTIERAQKKVEENNFGVRKRLLEYDDVMNMQRSTIYALRHNAMSGERIEIDLNNTFYNFADAFVENYGKSNFETCSFELLREVAMQPSFDEDTFEKVNKSGNGGELVDLILNDLKASYERHAKAVATTAMPTVKNVYENQGNQYQNILIPITDGRLAFNVSVDLKRAIESEGAEIYKMFTKIVTLVTIDDFWREHLREMDDLRQSVQNASYEQKDPLLIYKLESAHLFSSMFEDLNRRIISTLNKGFIVTREQAQQQRSADKPKVDVGRLHASHMAAAGNAGGGQSRPAPAVAEKKVGRNDPCPCGSGKKYKNCHGTD